jgi:hypothetical protein
MPTKTVKKVVKITTRVADAFKKFPFELKPEDLKLLTQGQIEFAESLKAFHSSHKAKRYIENCVKMRKGLCVYCNCADIIQTVPSKIKKPSEKPNPYRYKCTNCKQFW